MRELYGRTITASDLDAAFEQFTPEAVTLIASGQAAAATLSAAYLRALLATRGVPPPSIIDTSGQVGVNRDGRPLAEALVAIPSMVKLAIGQGKPRADAVALGEYLVRRTADAEIVRAADDATERAAEEHPRIVGWTGVVSSGACAPCQANRGEHSLGEPIYRHSGCSCAKQWVTA